MYAFGESPARVRSGMVFPWLFCACLPRVARTLLLLLLLLLTFVRGCCTQDLAMINRAVNRPVLGASYTPSRLRAILTRRHGSQAIGSSPGSTLRHGSGMAASLLSTSTSSAAAAAVAVAADGSGFSAPVPAHLRPNPHSKGSGEDEDEEASTAGAAGAGGADDAEGAGADSDERRGKDSDAWGASPGGGRTESPASLGDTQGSSTWQSSQGSAASSARTAPRLSAANAVKRSPSKGGYPSWRNRRVGPGGTLTTAVTNHPGLVQQQAWSPAALQQRAAAEAEAAAAMGQLAAAALMQLPGEHTASSSRRPSVASQGSRSRRRAGAVRVAASNAATSTAAAASSSVLSPAVTMLSLASSPARKL